MTDEMNTAVFLDRDGVINYDHKYVNKIKDFQFIPGVFEACRKFIAKGYKLIIITNQAGIARGYYTEHEFELLNNWMLEQFQRENINITAVYYCPHHPECGLNNYKKHCQCRKPEPGMIYMAKKEHNIDLASSILIGDKLSDIEAGRSAGIGKVFFVRTGKTVTEDMSRKADGVFDDLLSLTKSIGNFL